MEENKSENIESKIDHIISALDDKEVVTGILSEMRSEDIAEILNVVNYDEKIKIIRYLDQEKMSHVFAKTGADTIYAVIEELGPVYVAGILEHMEPEEAAEILSELEEEAVEAVLALMGKPEARKVKETLEYEEKTAGRLMSTDIIVINESTTPEQAIEYIRTKEIEKTHYYIYVVNNENRFIGLIPIHKIIFAKKNVGLGNIAEKEVACLPVTMDQEQVARLVGKYDVPALPVIDESGDLVGEITVDDVIDVINEENTEDIYRMAGTDYEEVFSESAIKVAKIRLPWLLACIFGSLLSGTVIRKFEVTLEQAISLVAFIPVIMATGGNTGLQSCTIMVRRLAMGNLSSYNIASNIFKEIRTALILGTVCGSLLFVIAAIWRGNPFIGFILGVSMFSAVSASSIVGLCVPILFKKIKIDPAVSSGPLITTLNDIIGLSIYLILSAILIKYMK